MFKRKWISKILFALPLIIITAMIGYGAILYFKPDIVRDEMGIELIKSDDCIKLGGCWDKLEKTCRRNEPNAQELCNRELKQQ